VESSDAEDQLDDLRNLLLDTMNKKRQLAKKEQEQKQEQTNMKILKEKERMNQDISMLKQKLVEHELALTTSNNQPKNTAAASSSQSITVTSLGQKPKILPIIIRLNPESEDATSDTDDDDLARKRAEAIAALKASQALDKNISLFLSEAKKLAGDVGKTMSGEVRESAAVAKTSDKDADVSRKRKNENTVAESDESKEKVAKITAAVNSAKLAEEVKLRNQLLLQRQIEKEKNEMIRNLRDKINLKRLFYLI
jgi:hypothetical protein